MKEKEMMMTKMEMLKKERVKVMKMKMIRNRSLICKRSMLILVMRKKEKKILKQMTWVMRLMTKEMLKNKTFHHQTKMKLRRM